MSVEVLLRPAKGFTVTRTLPVDDPPPFIEWADKVFQLVGNEEGTHLYDEITPYVIGPAS